jgi:hypothetical protein
LAPCGKTFDGRSRVAHRAAESAATEKPLGSPSVETTFAAARRERRHARAGPGKAAGRSGARWPFFVARLLRGVDKLAILPMSRRPLALGVRGA